MLSHSRRFALGLTASASGLVAFFAWSSGTATADVYELYGADATVVSASGQPPFDQSVLEQGTFTIYDATTKSSVGGLPGVYDSTASPGMSNVELVVNSDPTFTYGAHSVIDIFTIGDFQNQYADIVSNAPGAANQITDTLITPFGDFNIPVTFDAAAFGDTSIPAAATDVGALL